ncbi:MAG: GPW/gp25 family protein [Pseudomonadales bacterium]
MSTTLSDPPYMAFPFSIGTKGAEEYGRKDHIHDLIEQILFTAPGERVFRSDFGVGLRNLLFEPNGQILWEVVKKRIQFTLAEILVGEVDPQTIEIQAGGNAEQLEIIVSYALTRIGVNESQSFFLGI